MRIQCGLMIQRPPIFAHMRERDIKFMKHRSQIMLDYFMDLRKFQEEYQDVTKLNEDILATNPYVSDMNLDNYPTHISTEEGKDAEYCAISKNFAKVDPECTDRRSLHYAGEDRVFLLLKNKFTNKWEFPTGSIYMGQTFLRAKQELFVKLSENKWRIRFFSAMPTVTTIRDFTEAEKEDINFTMGLKGVRTYFFNARHLRGEP